MVSLEDFVERIGHREEIDFRLGGQDWHLMPKTMWFDGYAGNYKIDGWMYYVPSERKDWQIFLDLIDPIEIIKVPINGTPLIDQLDQVSFG